MAAHKQGRATNIKSAGKHAKGGKELMSCPSGFTLVTDASGDTWPEVAGVLDESKLAKSVIRVLDARFACQYNQFFTTECKKGKLMDDALGKDYCAGKNTLLVLDRKKAKTSKCPDVSGTTSRFRQNAGLDICYYFA
ncbi:MAG: hypothetical protein AAB425_04435, partial [Bdellovibrionota bacterium]